MNPPNASPRRAALAAVLLLVLAGFTAGCATNPVTGRRELSLVSSEQELGIGKEGYAAVVSEYGLYDDPRLQAYVDSIGQALAKQSHLPNLAWKFTVLDDPAVNAFAMPGGYIYITRGILAHLNSEAQLAGVLGHEIGHVTARHTAQRITQQQLATLGLGIASVVSETVGRYSQAAQTGLGLLFLKYGRDDENQADQLGVEYSVKGGWDPREIPATYAMLKRVGERGGERLPAFLSTHPDPGDREVRTTELARAASAGKTGLRVLSRGYVQRLEGVVYGNDPRQGFFEGANYYHPQLAFQFSVPAGWKTQNGKAAVMAVATSEKAGVQLTLESGAGLTPEQYFADLQRKGAITGTQGARETVGGYAAWIGRVQVTGSDGAARVLAAGAVRKTPEQLFRFLGQSAVQGDADETAIHASMRSFRALTDPAKLAVTPDRVHVAGVARAGTFRDVVAGLGKQAVDLDETALINNAELDQDVRSGELLKIVQPGRR